MYPRQLLRDFLVCMVGMLLVTALGCAPPAPPRLVLYVAEAERPPIDDFVALLPAVPVTIESSANPTAALPSADRDAVVGVALIIDAAALPACAGCYQLEARSPGYLVRGTDSLGLQYGLSHLLESFGVRFFHPTATYVPEALFGQPPAAEDFGRWMKPETALRGLHLHTLHPIESYYAFWEPGAANLKLAQQIIDWEVKNRGNYVQWVALDSLLAKDAEKGPWRAHTRAIIDYAHRRGLQVGIGLQLFGFSNLQHSFDLVDDKVRPAAEQIRPRLQLLLEGLPFDKVNLAFGEFFGTDPQNFIDTTNLTYDLLRAQAPAITMSATVHVGDADKQKVDYMGEHLIYYFLLKYANPAIVAWVHTVMYYNLFEDAGGAYQHKDFAAHREYLLGYLRRGKQVGYSPESAYWVAFDNSVPQYLPLYMRSRWLDLRGIRSAMPGNLTLPEHILFSTGWEWGYWQNDYVTLRMSYTLPGDWGDALRQMFAPLGVTGQTLATQVIQLAEVQHKALIEQRLAPYLAGRDLPMDLGRTLGIISAPDRPTFAELAMAPADTRSQFASAVLTPLISLAAATEELQRGLPDGRAAAALVPALQPWVAELTDGFAINAVRARFIATLYQAAAAYGAHLPTDAYLAAADQLLAQARQIVDHRHKNLHSPLGDTLVENGANATIFQFGYLKQAAALCYWERERIQLRNLLGLAKDMEPTCLF